MKHIKQPENIHRPWVKNAAIIFLSVMLVLTFFSRTIMNISLPEVTGQYLSSGTISRSVTGSGTVAANLAYNVQLEDTRTVKSVEIAAGDTVRAGQVLFTLDETESDELKSAQETLDQMEYDYGLALIQNVGADYASEYQQISAIREQLDQALADQEQAAADQARYDAARAAVAGAQAEVSRLEGEIADLQAQLAMAGAGDDTLDALRAALADAQAVQASCAADLAAREAEVTAAQSAVNISVADAQAALDAALAELARRQAALDALSQDTAPSDGDLPPDDTPAEETPAEDTPADDTPVDDTPAEDTPAEDTPAEDTPAEDTPAEDTPAEEAPAEEPAGPDTFASETSVLYAADSAYQAALQAVEEQQAVVAEAQAVLARAQSAEDALAEAIRQRDLAKKLLESAQAATQAAQQAVDDRVIELTDSQASQDLAEKQAELIPAQARLAEAQTALASLDVSTSYDAASEIVRSLRQQLAAANAALAEQQRADGVLAEAADYDLQAKADDIEEQTALVERLRSDADNDRVIAQYDGTVASVTSVTGDIVGPGITMATIHVEGKEFSLTMPVTAEQSMELSVGDQARVTDYYFGGVQAVITAIRSDPDAPGKNKLLEFTVSGDVTDGQNLALSIDLGTQNYPLVAPKSAIRTDADGDFILAAETESSPLGARYVVKRVPVTVVASDAYNAAIETATGSNYYYVVTTSTAPLSSGDQVRLTDQ